MAYRVKSTTSNITAVAFKKFKHKKGVLLDFEVDCDTTLLTKNTPQNLIN